MENEKPELFPTEIIPEEDGSSYFFIPQVTKIQITVTDGEQTSTTREILVPGNVPSFTKIIESWASGLITSDFPTVRSQKLDIIQLQPYANLYVLYSRIHPPFQEYDGLVKYRQKLWKAYNTKFVKSSLPYSQKKKLLGNFNDALDDAVDRDMIQRTGMRYLGPPAQPDTESRSGWPGSDEF